MVRVLTTGLDDYLRDESNIAGGWAGEVALPLSVGEVIEFVRYCAGKKEKITVSGSRTGIVGGAIPLGGAVISAERMTGIKGFKYQPESDEWRVIVEPGVTLLSLQQCVQMKKERGSRPIHGITDFQRDPRRFFFPVDATEHSASIGGMTATNASGARSFGYGSIRRYIRALQVVLADGEVINLRRGRNLVGTDGKITIMTESGKKKIVPAPRYPIPQVKHTAGFYNEPSLDAIDLFIGSEGLMGVITEVELGLMVEPEVWFSGLAFFSSEAKAIGFVRRVREVNPEEELVVCRPVALEYFDQVALLLFNESDQRKELQLPEIPGYAQAAIFFEQDCREADMEEVYAAWETALAGCGSSIGDVWSGVDPKDNQKLKQMRHAIPEAVNRIVSENRRKCPAAHKVGTDLAVPCQYLEDLFVLYRSRLVEEGIPAVIFGHIGDNNLHVNMLPADESGLKKAKLMHLEWARWVVERGGTVIAEHGVGKIKGELLRLLYTEQVLNQMGMVKQALDPEDLFGSGNGIFNGALSKDDLKNSPV